MNERAPEQPQDPSATGEATPHPPLPGPGDRVGPYVLGKLLGAGTGGRVFEAMHEKLGRPAALKLLDPAQASRPAARAKFLAEATAVGRISHPHIVEVIDVVEEAGHAALVMELLEGQSLGAAMAGPTPLAPERFLPILAQVCEALAAAHAAGFVHRDLKPENIFLCAREDGTDFVKLLDFGVATTFSSAAPLSWADRPSAVTSTGSDDGIPGRPPPRGPVVGTPAYASPEQASGGIVDRTADIYAVGVIVYELACRRLPYEGWTAGQFLIQHLSAPVPRLPADIRATPLGQSLDVVVQRCMAKRPADRFASAADLAATFSALACGDFATARATLPPPVAPRRRLRRGAAMALALAVVVGLSALSTRRVLESPPAPAVTAPAPAPPQAPAPVPFVMLSFTSEPAGAEVRGPAHDLYGVTPFSRAFPRSNEAQVIEFTRSGYAATHVQVTPSVTRAISVTLARAGHPRARPHGKRLGSEKTIDPFRR